jgi:MFS family permease
METAVNGKQPAAPAVPVQASSDPANAKLVLIALILVAAVANLNLSVANVALPSIGNAFDASQTQLNLVAVAYSLGLASSVLWLGALGDRYGRKLMLLLGVGLSVPACLIVAFAAAVATTIAAAPNGDQVSAAVQAQLQKSFASAEATAEQYPEYQSEIITGARESFLVGDQWAYTAGIIAVLIGGVIVNVLFPKKDVEEALLAQYHAEDAKALAAIQQAAAAKSGVPATATA